tara:strand:+ start:779 stop:889 length:111 start_codon:yes stop_codon:yes gene_type:complete
MILHNLAYVVLVIVAALIAVWGINSLVEKIKALLEE